MLDGVGFGYVSGRPVLHDVSLRLAAGDHVALVGPTVLILDEATADLDPATDALVTAALARVGTGRTLIVVAHRPATAARYPRVVHIDEGLITTDPHRTSLARE